jgi:hypothetical protein
MYIYIKNRLYDISFLVHGGWTVWSKWNACPVTCGLGMQKRYRNCSDPYPLRNGNHCFGDADEYRICFQQFCEGIFNQAEMLFVLIHVVFHIFILK